MLVGSDAQDAEGFRPAGRGRGKSVIAPKPSPKASRQSVAPEKGKVFHLHALRSTTGPGATRGNDRNSAASSGGHKRRLASEIVDAIDDPVDPIQNDLLGDPEREELGPENVAKITNIHGAAAIDFRTFITIGDYISIIETFNDLSEPIGIPYSEKIDAETSDIVTSEDGKFAYYIDFDTDELVTLDLMNGLSFKEAGRTKLADGNVDSIAISSSGMNLIVYDQNTTSSLSILRVSR